MSEHINVAEVPVELRNLTGARVPYRALYSRVLDGDLPVEKSRGRYYANRKDLPQIAKILGLMPKVAT
jgi:hypothetical protein